MPAKVKVRILAGRNLPVMDKSSDASDAFVEVKLGNTTYKTEVYRRSLNPFWNSEWFRFEVSDQELQDEPLQIRVMDYDTYSANDAIGKVYINLNPLLVNQGRSMSGWLPIYDTLHGIRGEINCMVKVNLFADNNRYRHSSCGVRFFFSDIPNGYKCDAILGFVDELLVNDDPEYQWIDKIRTPRASNEARQTLFTKLSGEVQRKLGLKAEIFGGNAVIGYQLSFDLEGGSGIVGRGIGTAVVLSKIGFPYDGIISTPHMNNNDQHHSQYSRFTDGSRPSTGHYYRGRTQTRQSLNLYQRQKAERRLIHSSSADHFFENSNKKKLYASMKPSSLYKVDSEDENDESDCLDYAGKVIADECSESDSDSNDPSTGATSNSNNSDSFSPARKAKNFFRSNRPLSTNNSLESKTLSFEKSKTRRPSAGLLLKNLLRTNENVSQKLSIVTRPLTSSYGLIDNLLFRRQQQQRLQSSSCMENNPDKQDHDIGAITQKQTLGTTENIPQTQPKQDQVNKFRQMTRMKEVDLNDENEPNEYQLRPLGSSFSSSVDDEDNFEAETKLSMANRIATTTATATTTENSSDNILSSSSPSTSLLTDETIKARIKSHKVPKEHPMESHTRARSLSNGNKSISKSQLERSNTDISQQFSANSQQETGIVDSSDTLVEPDDVLISKSNIEAHQKYYQNDNTDGNKQFSLERNIRQCNKNSQKSPSPQKVASTSGGGANNFVQSVRAVKASQHLLQNMVKHQNQNLLTSSSLRAKNAFMCPNRLHQSEYPFVTLKRYPENMIQSTGGVVSVHSVKLLDHIINDEESETRDIWWTEIRKEIRSHAKALNCSTILGYTETSKVLGDVCILSAFGTAAILKPLEFSPTAEGSETTDNQTTQHQYSIANNNPAQLLQNLKVNYQINSAVLPDGLLSSPSQADLPDVRDLKQSSLQTETSEDTTNSTSMSKDCSTTQSRGLSSISGTGNEVDPEFTSPPPITNSARSGCAGSGAVQEIDCSFCHTSLVCVESISSLPSCTICGSSKVPDILLLTIEPPQNLNIVSVGTLVQARVCRTKRDSHGEASAKEIGDALPFLEYELHRQLFGKLKFKGMNCLFNFCVDISIGENMLTGIATGTGCFVLGLPAPEPPLISAGKGIKTSKLNEIKSLIAQSAEKNRKQLGLEYIDSQLALYHELCHQMRQAAETSSALPALSSAERCREPLKGSLTAIDSTCVDVTDTQQQESEFISQAQVISGESSSTFVKATLDARREANSCSPTSLANTSITNSTSYRHQKNVAASASHLPDRDGFSHSGVAAISKKLVTSKHSKSSHRHQQHHHYHHHSRQQKGSNHVNAISVSPDKSLSGPTENLINLLSADSNIVLEVDDNEDADIIALLIDTDIPAGYIVCNSESIPSVHQSSITSINMFTHVARTKLTSLDQFAQQFDWILQSLFVKLRRSLPCCLTNISFLVDLPETHVIQISVTGCLLGLLSPVELGDDARMSLGYRRSSAQPNASLSTADYQTTNSSIDISSLSYIPGAKEYHYLGNLAFSFVRETNSVRENGGLNGFIHCFLMEVYAIVRAHISALGGNAFLSFRLQQSCIFYHSNKNQAQCLISVAGDAVQVTL